MARIKPLRRDELPSFVAEEFSVRDALFGFSLNDYLTLGRNPDLLDAVMRVARITLHSGPLPAEIRWLVGHVASVGGACRYCQAHTAFIAGEKYGVAAEKIAAVFDFEHSEHFTNAERAALRVAYRGGLVPCAVEDEDFDELRRYFSEEEIVQLVGIVATFGFLNRWNAIVATELESPPRQFGERHLAAAGWTVEAHVADGERQAAQPPARDVEEM